MHCYLGSHCNTHLSTTSARALCTPPCSLVRHTCTHCGRQSPFRASRRTLGSARAPPCGAVRRQAAHRRRAALAHRPKATHRWPATGGQHSRWPFSINIRPLLSCFSDLRKRTHGPNMRPSLDGERCEITRAPCLFGRSVATHRFSTVPSVKDVGAARAGAHVIAFAYQPSSIRPYH